MSFQLFQYALPTDSELTDLNMQSLVTSLFAHVQAADDLKWRNTLLSLHDSYTGHRDTQERISSDPRRELEQFSRGLPLRDSQQEEARQLQQESGISGLSVPRHEDCLQKQSSTDDACSRSASNRCRTNPE